MDHDGLRPKLSRRDFLRASFASASAALLAACGAATPAAPEATSAPAAATAAPAPTSAPAPTAAAAAATEAPTAAAAAATAAPTAAATATPLPLPEGAAGKLTIIHRTEYFENVQKLFRSSVEDFAKQQGITLDISTANPELFGDFIAQRLRAL